MRLTRRSAIHENTRMGPRSTVGWAALGLGLLLGLALAPADAANISNRWSETATNGSGLTQGDPTTLTWGFVPDGTAIAPQLEGESSEPSDLIASLDNIRGDGGGGSDLTQRPWFSVFQDSYDRLDAVSGLSFTYQPEDPGSSIDRFSPPEGSNTTPKAPDLRIAGHSIDGQSGSNVLAYNYFPDHGDMVIDTDNSNFYSNTSNDSRAFRNVVMHETGHGLGLGHFNSSDGAFLMEPFINTSFDGPQFDDILGLQRSYGDALEENGGNDDPANAVSLGSFISTAGSASVGTQGDSTAVAAAETDFLSIDGDSDTDFFEFTVGSNTEADILLTPKGPTYDFNGSSFDASELNDLALRLLDASNNSVLAASDVNGLGEAESILNFELPSAGDYLIELTGLDDAAQLYELNLDVSPVPQPAALLLGLIAAPSLILRRPRHGAFAI